MSSSCLCRGATCINKKIMAPFQYSSVLGLFDNDKNEKAGIK